MLLQRILLYVIMKEVIFVKEIVIFYILKYMIRLHL